MLHSYGGWWWALVSPDGVAPSRLVNVSASVNLPLHHKVQKFSSRTSSPGWSRKKGRKTVVCVCVCVTFWLIGLLVRFCCVTVGLVSSIPCCVIDWEERLLSDLFLSHWM